MIELHLKIEHDDAFGGVHVTGGGEAQAGEYTNSEGMAAHIIQDAIQHACKLINEFNRIDNMTVGEDADDDPTVIGPLSAEAPVQVEG